MNVPTSGPALEHMLLIMSRTENEPFFSSDKRSGWKARPCPKCGKVRTAKGHDPCIADLPGVVHACCGHGQHPGYIVFHDGVTIRGEFEQTR